MKISRRLHRRPNPHALYVISLGCPKNRVDTECMLGELDAAGYHLTDDLSEAGCVLINTCGFLGAAVQEAYGEIEEIVRAKRRIGFRLVVTGCLVERLGEQLRQDFPEIDALLGVRTYTDIRAAMDGDLDVTPVELTPAGDASYYLRRTPTTGQAWTYLRVADGCENRCTYCTIPDIRGAFRSRPLEDILGEARAFAARGVKELNLIAQDTTRYGDDLYGRRSLDRLLDTLNTIDGVRWIRLLYTHPAHYDDAFIAALTRNEKVIPYLDIPLQHIADPMLRAMHRRVTKAETISLLQTLRSTLPELVLRTTFIVGFPGETEALFQELLDFVEEFRFERAGAFAYSREPGTPAADLPDQVPDEVKCERVDRLMRLQQRISHEQNRALQNRRLEVLVEGPTDASPQRGYPFAGRSYADAPEIDGQVFLRTLDQASLQPGQFVTARIEYGYEYDLCGVVETSLSS